MSASCGLAKRLEEVWLPDVEEPVILPRTSEGLYLLQRLRDEAHRFAITHHRPGAASRWWSHCSTRCPGLGEVRRKALISSLRFPEEAAGGNRGRDRCRARFRPKTAAAIKLALQEAPRPQRDRYGDRWRRRIRLRTPLFVVARRR